MANFTPNLFKIPHLFRSKFNENLIHEKDYLFSWRWKLLTEQIFYDINLVIMDIKTVIVPKGVRYISQWENFNLPDFPNIIDKQIPGCGFTEYCITNNQNIILVSPRKILLQNKWDQHKDVYLVKSILPELGVDLDLSDKRINKPGKSSSKKETERKPEDLEAIRRNYTRIKEEVIGHYLTRSVAGFPSKILVTYDSYGKVKEALSELGVFDQFYTVVDEFQSIFVDAKFKSETEIEFLNHLSGVQKVCYVSATPMLSDYLSELDEFKNLPYFRFDWETEDKSRVIKPRLEIKSLKTVSSDSYKIIESYRLGNFKTSARVNADGVHELVESREAVFYVNSVNNIINIISRAGLNPEEVNILCADTPNNLKKIQKKLGKDFTIGSVPLKNEPRKMFTFCTRTVYLGADFYSDNARTFIFSDANIDSMSVDITLDLPQILGRQRLESNPWKNRAIIYVRVKSRDKTSLEEFKKTIEEKTRLTQRLMENYKTVVNKDEMTKVYEDRAADRKYSEDYVAVNKHGGSNKFPVINHLVRMAEQRAYDIQQIDYADRFSVFNVIKEGGFEVMDSEVTQEIVIFQDKFDKAKTQREKMKTLCTESISEAALPSILNLVPEYMKRFYIMLGPDRCRALSYDYPRMTNEIKNISIDRSIVAEKIFSEFQIGDKLSRAVIKEKLIKIYAEVGYNKAAKSKDLEEWFELGRAQIKNSVTGKFDAGYEFLAKKTN